MIIAVAGTASAVYHCCDERLVRPTPATCYANLLDPAHRSTQGLGQRLFPTRCDPHDCITADCVLRGWWTLSTVAVVPHNARSQLAPVERLRLLHTGPLSRMLSGFKHTSSHHEPVEPYNMQAPQPLSPLTYDGGATARDVRGSRLWILAAVAGGVTHLARPAERLSSHHARARRRRGCSHLLPAHNTRSWLLPVVCAVATVCSVWMVTAACRCPSGVLETRSC